MWVTYGAADTTRCGSIRRRSLTPLPGLRFPLPGHAFPTGQQMADYLGAYVASQDLPVRTGEKVERLVRTAEDDGYEVTTGTSRYRAHQVIVATGPFQRPYVPDFASDLDPAIRQLHSADYRNPGQLVDGPVLVVGVSHSGADIAFEVARAGHRTMLSGINHGQLPFPVDSRRMRLLWPVMRALASSVLTLRTPIGRKAAVHVKAHGGPLLRVRRPDLERAGVTRYPARTASANGGRPVLADGTVLDVANIIWCTGFRPDFSWIELPVIGADGWPNQRRGVVELMPGLYFLGLPFLYAFASMLVLGAARDAEFVVGRVTARRTRQRPRVGAATEHGARPSASA